MNINLDFVTELINNSDMSDRNKMLRNTLIKRCEADANVENERKEFINGIDINAKVDKVELFTESIIVYICKPNYSDNDSWDNLYPYRYLYKNKKDKWMFGNPVSRTFDECIICALGSKYLGDNQYFPSFVYKMLGIPNEE